MNNRLRLIGAAMTALFIWTSAMAAKASDWTEFKDAHLSSEGAVLDSGSGLVHSEGQSYAMLLAVRNNDRAAFDAAWSFARDRLKRPDGLFSWKYENGVVTDPNNATDGDIVIAWALIEAGRVWDSAYAREAMPILAAIRSKLVLRTIDPADSSKSLFVLLPGEDGFKNKDGGFTINLSYYVFPAFDAFASIDDPTFWNNLSASGARLIDIAADRSGGLTPDWAAFPSMGPAEGLSYRASYDALRVPLFLAWSGRSSATFQAWRSLWRSQAIAWSDPSTGEAANYGPGAEQLAILALLDRAASSPEGTPDRLPAIGKRTPYFASAIVLLTREAWKERFSE